MKKLKDEEKWQMAKSAHIYQDFVMNIMRKVHILYNKQLVTCLVNTFELSNSLANYIINNMQRENRIIKSVDGMVMTQDYYRMVTGDIFFDSLNFNDKESVIPFPFHPVAKEFNNEIDDRLNEITLISKLMPMSNKFVVTLGVFDVVFLVEENSHFRSCLYEIVTITKKNYLTRIALLKEALSDEDDEIKDVVNRVAIVDDALLAQKINCLGFKDIIMINGEKITYLEKSYSEI